ncbi:protein TolB [Streptomyces sp. KL118A]|uniref:protein TolB n=1 Tax=Streptomyces sp. KL118A TaxID=3045153 RepID=UPI00278C0258|nr:protein TolB [Streptomyces sp. KL118A]
MSTVSRVSLSALLVAALGATALPAAAARTAQPAQAAPRVERVSVAADGTEADGASAAASLSGNGRYVAFRSDAENLTEGHQGPYDYGFVRDLRTGEVTRLKNSMGAPVISDDGRYAAHTGWGTHGINVFLTDLSTGERKQIDGSGFKDSSAHPSISADGRFVAYKLQPRHPGDPARVEVYDRETDTREVVSEGPPDAARDMVDPSISGDGRYVAYTDAGTDQVWLRDRTTGGLARIDDGSPSTVAQVNGRTVALNSPSGAYVRDLRTGRTQHFSARTAQAVSPDGHQLLYGDAGSNVILRDLRSGREVRVGHGSAGAGAVAPKGRGIVYSSEDTDVVPGDTNGFRDVFKWTRHRPH